MRSIPQFHSIGSDPEFLFVTKQEFRPTIIPANTVITGNKVVALNSFIGTDNHAATAEMRPGPSHNVARHMYDIAYGLHETDKWLASHKRFNQVKIVAQPYVGDEPLGGHIHCSFFVDEPAIMEMAGWNRVFAGDRIVTLNPNLPVPVLNPAQIAQLNEYAKKKHRGELFGTADFAEFMDYLILPYECAVQPWWDRMRRNGRYGGIAGIGDRVRQNFSIPKSNKVNKFAYLHYEYRVPSTWLCHPWLAYAYLGLAKLAMINAKLISEAVVNDDKIPTKNPNGIPANQAYTKLFKDRFKFVVENGKWTNDTKALRDIIPKTFDNRAAWFETPGNPVDIDSWRRLL